MAIKTLVPQLLGQVAIGGGAQWVEFSPDGNAIAVGVYQSSVSLYDVASLKRTKQIKGMPGHVYRVAYFPDGSRLAAGGPTKKGGWVAVIDTDTGQTLSRLDTHSDVYVLAVSPDGSSLVAGCLGGELICWDTKAWKRTELLPHQDDSCNEFGVADAAFAPNGKRLVTAQLVDDKCECTTWDAGSWKRGKTVPLTDPPDRLAFSPDGKTVCASNYSGITFLDAATLKRTGGAKMKGGGPSRYLGRDHLVMGSDREPLRLMSVRSKKVIATINTMAHITTSWDEVEVGPFALSPDGQLAATVCTKLDIWKLPAI